MRAVIARYFVCLMAVSAAGAPPLELTAEQDHQLMMKQLGIVSLRPGRQWPRPECAECRQLR
jgi:hypothetical protein